eukprot:5501396-Amphidinium_carterae.1
MKTAIVDEHYIDYMLHQRGLGMEDAEGIKEREIERREREHQRDVSGPILRANTELARRRRNAEDGVPADAAVPPLQDLPGDYDPFTKDERKHIEDFTEAFYHYSRVLQYTLTKITKGD